MKYELSSGWRMKCADIHCDIDAASSILGSSDGWMDVSLPCDIRVPLIENEIIKDPVIADYCFDSDWIEGKSWWFVNEFDLDLDATQPDSIELVCESLDADAHIILNGTHIGHHKNAFRPFIFNAKKLLRNHGNLLVIRLTTGIEHYSDEDLAGIEHSINTEEVRNRPERGDKRRVFVRKPQYCFGWDWCPRIVTCGITAPVYFIVSKAPVIRRLHCSTLSIGESAELLFEVEIESLRPFSTLDVELSLHINFKDREVFCATNDALLKSGLNYFKIPVEISQPQLWWPNGMGNHPLYEAKMLVTVDGSIGDEYSTKFGIRTIDVNMERDGSDGRGFTFYVNGIRLFCKGANWIPADSIYARVSNEKYEKLIVEAAQCNFNMLRVWGGGLYERDIFYDLCDSHGLLVWQDFMFACAVYPDIHEWFRREAELEMEYQTRRLATHPCLALWCGNNENAQCFDDLWIGDRLPAYLGGVICYNNIAPRIVHKNCPEIPYWNSSPYGGEHPNSSLAGDKHLWSECVMNEEMEKRISPEEYDVNTAKFVSEFGYPGPCVKESIERYLDGEPLDRESNLWSHHNNTFEKNTVEAGITKHYLDAAHVSIDDYLLYASLCQGLMLNYSIGSMLATEHCSGSLYWMYNDSWGETGWPTIDYYLLRKPSYYFVKRAFSVLQFVLRARESTIYVTGINDTNQSYNIEMEYGYMSFDGAISSIHHRSIHISPHFRGIAFTFLMEGYDTLTGCYFAKPTAKGVTINPAILRTTEYRHLQIPKAKLSVSDFKQVAGNASFNVTSDFFAHAVHFLVPSSVNFSDNYFDLLPGENRHILAEKFPDDISFDSDFCANVYPSSAGK